MAILARFELPSSSGVPFRASLVPDISRSPSSASVSYNYSLWGRAGGIVGVLLEWCGAVRRLVVVGRQLGPMSLVLPGWCAAPPPRWQLQIVCICPLSL